jgi:hypothetical protein
MHSNYLFILKDVKDVFYILFYLGSCIFVFVLLKNFLNGLYVQGAELFFFFCTKAVPFGRV